MSNLQTLTFFSKGGGGGGGGDGGFGTRLVHKHGAYCDLVAAVKSWRPVWFTGY